jgi:hypothetical protein
MAEASARTYYLSRMVLIIQQPKPYHYQPDPEPEPDKQREEREDREHGR